MKIKAISKRILSTLLALLYLFTPLKIVKAQEVEPITEEDFDRMNPLLVGGGDATLTTPGGIISKILEFSFPLAGMILFVMLVWGGFEMIYGASTSKAMEAGKNRVTAALIGFFLLFASFWIIQILQEVLGINILI